MNKVLIIGAGSHGRVVAETAEACGYNVAFLDDQPGVNVVGSLDEIEQYASQYDGVIVSIGDNEKRKELLKKITNPITLIHPRSYISLTASIGKGTIILPGAVVNTRAVIGKGCIISIGALIDHDSVVGDYCHINAGAVIEAGCIIPFNTKVDAGTTIKKKTN